MGTDVRESVFGVSNLVIAKPAYSATETSKNIVRVFSDVLVAFLYFDICHNRR